jgi:hypothetical protein
VQDKFELKFNGTIAVVGQVQTLYQELSQFSSCRNSTHNDPPFTTTTPPECFEHSLWHEDSSLFSV